MVSLLHPPQKKFPLRPNRLCANVRRMPDKKDKNGLKKSLPKLVEAALSGGAHSMAADALITYCTEVATKLDAAIDGGDADGD